jgi:carboxyl-terminal processing protease
VLAVLAAVVAVGLIFTAGAWVGVRDPQSLPPIIRDRIVDHDGAGAVNEALGVIRDDYYKDPGESKLVDDAIDGMVDGLGDRFSAYLDPKDFARFQETQDNRLDGIGVVVSQDDRGLLISRVYAGAPAKEAGLRAGDVIVEADGRSLKGLTADQASGRVRGPAGTKVRLVVVRRSGGKDRRLTITSERRPVQIPIVDSALKTEDGERVGVVRLAQFTNGAASQVKAAFTKLQGRGARRFVLDLRSNPGGLVNEAQDLAGLFLKGGTVVTLKGRTIGTSVYRAGGDPAFPRVPLVVLVDRGSASASEIVSGALQDRDRATIVGTRTFGKGVFQRVEPLASGGALDITAGQFYTPNGRNLGDKATQSGKGTAPGKGLAPDVQAADDAKTPKTDEALDGALRQAVKEGTNR